jgi:hypothetical protein
VVDQRAIFRNHRYDIVDSGDGGDVYTMGAARRDLMVDWMVRRGIRLDSGWTYFTIFLILSIFACVSLNATLLFINYAIRNTS